MQPPPELGRAVGRRLAEIRRYRGLTQEVLAPKLGMNVKHLQRIESGQNLTLRTIELLVAVLEVPPWELLYPVGTAIPGRAVQPLASLRALGIDVSGKQSAGRVPVLSLEVAAGYLRAPASVKVLGWCVVPGRRARPPAGTFVAQVVGDSMHPRIPRGAWCVFGPIASGDLVGRILLVEHRGIVDADTGGSFAVKKIAAYEAVGGGRRRVTLEALNKRYKPTVIEVTEDEDLRPVAELVGVLGG